MFMTLYFEVALEFALEIKSFFLLKMEAIADSKGLMKTLMILGRQPARD